MSNFVIDIDGDRARGKSELNEFMLRPEAIYSNLQGWYDEYYVRIDGRWHIEVRRVHLSPETMKIATTGKVGEYFKDFWTMCEKYIVS